MSTIPEIPPFIDAELPAEISRKAIQIEDLTIHYLEKGTGIPVFMMHGNPTWSFIYRNIMDNLDGNQFRCIAPDLPGLGFSTKVKSKFHTLENHQRIMSLFVQEVIQEDFIFLGQDWGGPIGLLASMNSRDKLKGILLLNTMIRPPKKDFKPTAFHSFSRMPLISEFTFRVLKFPQNSLHKAQGDTDSIKGNVRRAYMFPLRNLWTNSAPLMMARMVPNSQDHPSVGLLQQTEEFASSFEGPTGLFWGKKDPILGRLLSAHQKIMEHAEVEKTGGGHFIQEEHPAEIAAMIQRIASKITQAQ